MVVEAQATRPNIDLVALSTAISKGLTTTGSVGLTPLLSATKQSAPALAPNAAKEPETF
jgi:hypothetical protein